jgi:hypothetical protein
MVQGLDRVPLGHGHDGLDLAIDLRDKCGQQTAGQTLPPECGCDTQRE